VRLPIQVICKAKKKPTNSENHVLFLFAEEIHEIQNLLRIIHFLFAGNLLAHDFHTYLTTLILFFFPKAKKRSLESFSSIVPLYEYNIVYYIHRKNIIENQ
jgi:hypothetical protein